MGYDDEATFAFNPQDDGGGDENALQPPETAVTTLDRHSNRSATLDIKYPPHTLDADNPFREHLAERNKKGPGASSLLRTISLRRGGTTSNGRSLNRLNRGQSTRRVKPLMRSEDEAPPLARVGATSSRQPGQDDRLDSNGTLLKNTNDDETSSMEKRRSMVKMTWWVRFSILATCCFPPSFLERLGLKAEPVRQAWREKVRWFECLSYGLWNVDTRSCREQVALCLIILMLCFLVGLLTFFLRILLCNGIGNGVYPLWRPLVW